ncbi:hypothetical protein QA641_35265 [Bradyrhizobium sp. CB1650]|uniref:hypothetical protein n=1 Tax=Bradyrhizobium sp. CB1650 TaxID=3039153 RepID=UPI002434F189|nr:hypothetical protein [Bradyrhizobium sp. CB1650]WGD50804.1 hypothetical protein QA641_35265 [Bradyrhizobium sp. CB1650]
MLTLLGARFAAASSARGRHLRFKWPLLATLALVLAGCMPATAPLTDADPADPRARVARVGYRSTIAPYTSLRPATPAPWRERNDSVSPQPKTER